MPAGEGSEADRSEGRSKRRLGGPAGQGEGQRACDKIKYLSGKLVSGRSDQKRRNTLLMFSTLLVSKIVLQHRLNVSRISNHGVKF